MPTLETGKRTAGYTLLEVVAVLTLIGLIIGLTYPRINFALEQVEIGYMGRLIKFDLSLVEDESLSDPSSEMVVTFTKDGYSFTIGEHRISRSFKYQFVFELPEPKHQGELQEPEAARPQIDNEESSTGQAENVTVSYDLKIIKGELSGEESQLHWQTSHFQGSLLYQKDGTVGWKYGKK